MVNKNDFSNHNIEVTGVNSRPVGSEAKAHTVYFNVIGDSIYYADRVAKTKSLSRKIVRKDGEIYFRYNNYKYNLKGVFNEL